MKQDKIFIVVTWLLLVGGAIAFLSLAKFPLLLWILPLIFVVVLATGITAFTTGEKK